MVWDTAGNIINDAAVELGLGTDADPYTSTDPVFIQLRALLKSTGRKLLSEHQWTQFRREYTFTTVLGTNSYDLPADFHDMRDQTGWNRTNRLPLGGPLSPQEWQYLKARLAGVVFTVLFRPVDKKILIYPDVNTPGGYVIAFEYRSLFWAHTTNDASLASLSAPTASTNYVFFDPTLALHALKLAWARAKGFDSTAIQQDYDEALVKARNFDSPAPVLSLNKKMHMGIDPLIGQQSVPITGFGS